jgi:ATP-dependent protease ClpP protease subunit
MEATPENPKSADIYIFDIIGGWAEDYWYGSDSGMTTAKTFLETLSKVDASVVTLNAYINSPGGDVFSGIAIANALREQKAKGRTVNVFIEGLAASIASVIAMGGDTITMADNALMMVHHPWSWAIGNAAEMRKAADELDKCRDVIVASYQWHSTKSAEELIGLMDAETWMTADEAIANGLAHAKVGGLRAAALLPPHAAARLTVPEQHKARVAALISTEQPTTQPFRDTEQPADAKAILSVCREYECVDLAEGFLDEKLTLEQVTAQAVAVKAERRAAKQRETDIAAACKVANLTSLAGGYVRSAMSVADVKAALTDISALVAKTNIDSGLKPSAETTSEDWSNAFATANGSRLKKSR